ncbi:YceI family protein [Christiangramia sp.]|uniref:YceI family protein n=1 Tax=Christiangramia sp. TaxID=1931228 RepID=UPI0026070B5E|nr:YceI family protein [Christiangramia sp.]
MYKVLLLILAIFICSSTAAKAQFYQTTSAKVSFFSSAPVEDIKAVSNEGVAVLNSANGSISFKVKMRSFGFEKALMQEHFNENYVESEKFPEATFKGESTKEIDLDSNSPQQHILKGIFTVHGVSKERILPVTVTVLNNGKKLQLESKFNVACKDHNIKIPKILWENIAEVIEVNINADFQIIPR